MSEEHTSGQGRSADPAEGRQGEHIIPYLINKPPLWPSLLSGTTHPSSSLNSSTSCSRTLLSPSLSFIHSYLHLVFLKLSFLSLSPVCISTCPDSPQFFHNVIRKLNTLWVAYSSPISFMKYQSLWKTGKKYILKVDSWWNPTFTLKPFISRTTHLTAVMVSSYTSCPTLSHFLNHTWLPHTLLQFFRSAICVYSSVRVEKKKLWRMLRKCGDDVYTTGDTKAHVGRGVTLLKSGDGHARVAMACWIDQARGKL